MSNDFDLVFSEEALLSKVLFLAKQTTISIFVEDVNKEYEYEEIFEKIFPDEFKVDCIFPTGGKPKLEEAYRLFGQSSEYGKTFFIADGDFDVILHKKMIVADNFLYLKKYNIESYLINESAVIKYMRPRLQKSLKETREIINYSVWIDCISDFFKELFAVHCVVQRYVPHIENVARNPAQFLTEKGSPNRDRLYSYEKEVSAVITDFETKKQKMLLDLTACYGNNVGDFVCGKYYICALKLFLNNKLKKKINEDEVKAFLINNFCSDELAYVKETVFNYICA